MEKFFAVENSLDKRNIIAFGNTSLIREKPFLAEKFFPVETFLDQGKIFAFPKIISFGKLS